jgi:hypothetical protein
MSFKYVTDTQKLWGYAISLFIGLLLVMSLLRDLVVIRSGHGRFAEAEVRLDEAINKNESLQAELETVKSEEYRDMFIRNKLSMYREEELVVILPEMNTPTFEDEIKTVELSNREKWWKLLWR